MPRRCGPRDQFDAGRTIAEVAAMIGTNYGRIVATRVRFGIAPTRATHHRVDLQEVRRRLEAGQSVTSIGRALGLHVSVISALERRIGWSYGLG